MSISWYYKCSQGYAIKGQLEEALRHELRLRTGSPRAMSIYRREYNSQPHRRERVREIQRQRMAEDINYRIRRRLSGIVKRKFNGHTKTRTPVKLLGCSIPDFKIYIESKFEVSMSWENYGKVWHLDHIVPCAIFDLSKPEHQKRCFHFSNYQPLFSLENRRKYTKTDGQLRLI